MDVLPIRPVSSAQAFGQLTAKDYLRPK